MGTTLKGRIFTKNKTKSLAVLTITAAVSLSACTRADLAKLAKQKTMPEVEPTSSIVEVVEEKFTSNVPAFIKLLEEYYTNGKTTNEVLDTEDKSSTLYSSALYVRLREFGLDDETIQKELFNVVNFGLVHPDESDWKNDLLVRNLNLSLNYECDAICYYYPLAAYYHLANCDLEHNYAGIRINCEKISTDLNTMNDSILFANYAVENILALDDNDEIKICFNRIVNSGEDIEACINELESIYKMAMVPRCSTEEEWDSIAHLRSTLEDTENPCTYYYNLATYVHQLHCGNEHYNNEFGQVECAIVREEINTKLKEEQHNYTISEITSLADDNSLKIALNTIINSDQDTDACLDELEYVYELAMIPRCASDEEWKMISHLVATLPETENPCMYYYELACYVHKMNCEESHYTNEFGQEECQSLRKKMNGQLN